MNKGANDTGGKSNPSADDRQIQMAAGDTTIGLTPFWKNSTGLGVEPLIVR